MRSELIQSIQKFVLQNKASEVLRASSILTKNSSYSTVATSSSSLQGFCSSQPQTWRRRQTSGQYQHFQTRKLSTTSSKFSHPEIFLPGNIVQSPIPHIDVPTNIPFHQLMFDKCDEFKDMPAMSDFLTGRTYTFNQLKDKSIRVASALSRKGYKKGDIILAFSPNQIDYTVLMLAASCLGAWFCAANPSFTSEDLARQIHMSDSVAIFAHQVLTGIADQALNSKDFPNKIKDKFVFGEASGYQPFQQLVEDDGKAFPDVSINPMEDVFTLPYSSGTTGLPKGVMLSHYNVLANTLQTRGSFQYKPDDSVLGLLPLYHIYGMVVVQFGSIINGAHLHLLPKFEPESFLNCLQDKEITVANLVPPLVLFLTKHPMVNNYDLSKLITVICGAAPLGKEISKAFVETFNNQVSVIQGFGLTETSPVTHIDIGQNYGSVGSLVGNTTAKVVDLDSGEVCGPNQTGEVCVKGPQIMLGYYRNDKATKEMVGEDGWLSTGDIGHYDEIGNFYISDRLKELIKYKGSQVAPAELEALLISHPDIADACVIGLPDERAGEVPKAFVVKKADSALTEENIAKFVDDQVSNYKKLRGGVEFIQEIPKNPSGKILRRMLK